MRQWISGPREDIQCLQGYPLPVLTLIGMRDDGQYIYLRKALTKKSPFYLDEVLAVEEQFQTYLLDECHCHIITDQVSVNCKLHGDEVIGTRLLLPEKTAA